MGIRKTEANQVCEKTTDIWWKKSHRTTAGSLQRNHYSKHGEIAIIVLYWCIFLKKKKKKELRKEYESEAKEADWLLFWIRNLKWKKLEPTSEQKSRGIILCKTNKVLMWILARRKLPPERTLQVQSVNMRRELPGFTLSSKDGRREIIIKCLKILIFKDS